MDDFKQNAETVVKQETQSDMLVSSVYAPANN